MKQLIPISKCLHFNALRSSQLDKFSIFYLQMSALLHTIKIIVLPSFSRHKLKLLSKCCVFKVRQYISADIQSTTFKLRLKTQKKWQSNLKHTLLYFGPKFQSQISVVGPQSVLHKSIAVTYDSKFKLPKRARRTWKYPTHLFVHS